MAKARTAARAPSRVPIRSRSATAHPGASRAASAAARTSSSTAATAARAPRIRLPSAPMEALSVAELPDGEGWQYEPKWDGFRCLVAKQGARVELRSKAGQPLARYFPEVVEHLRALTIARCVLDGELIVPAGAGSSFGALLQRIHPAASRIERLARETPATLVVFDLLADARGTPLGAAPLRERRARLQQLFKRELRGEGVRLSPMTRDRAAAQAWLDDLAGGLDGVVAKRLDEPYQPGERSMRKIKRVRTADCVVGGFRANAERGVVSLLLGLHDDDGLLHHVGHTANLPRDERKPLAVRLGKITGGPGFSGRAPGGPSRWSNGRDSAWTPVKPELVVEVSFDHASEGRFRHGASFVRWRPDKAPRQCRMEQLGGVVADR